MFRFFLRPGIRGPNCVKGHQDISYYQNTMIMINTSMMINVVIIHATVKSFNIHVFDFMYLMFFCP